MWRATLAGRFYISSAEIGFTKNTLTGLSHINHHDPVNTIAGWLLSALPAVQIETQSDWVVYRRKTHSPKRDKMDWQHFLPEKYDLSQKFLAIDVTIYRSSVQDLKSDIRNMTCLGVFAILHSKTRGQYISVSNLLAGIQVAKFNLSLKELGFNKRSCTFHPKGRYLLSNCKIQFVPKIILI